MTYHYADFDADVGLTQTVELFSEGSDTVVKTADQVTAQTNRKGTYRARFSDVSAGVYELRSRVSTTPKSSWYARFAGTADEVVTGRLSRENVSHIAETMQTAGDLVSMVQTVQNSLYAGSGVVNSLTSTGSSIVTNLNQDDNYWNDALFTFTSGAMSGLTRAISTFTQTDGVFTFDEPFPGDPAYGDVFNIIRTHVHPVSQIQSGLALEATSQSIYSRIGPPANASIAADIAEVLSAVESSSGTGARTVTITVNDGTTVIESANVRLTKGAESFIQQTNVSGQVVFSVDDGTWTVAITCSGYTFTSTTLVVDGNETQTYSMTQVSYTPSDPGQVTGYLYCYNTSGGVASGVSITIQQLKPISGSGIAYDGSTRTETSAGSGLVQFTGLFLGGRYRLYRGDDDQNPTSFTVETDQTDPMELPSVIDIP